MRADRLIQPYFLTQIFYDGENHNPCKLRSSSVQEEDVFVFGINVQLRTINKVVVDIIYCLEIDRNEPFFIAFTYYTYVTLLKKEIG